MIIGVLEYGEVRVFEDIEEALKEWGRYPGDIRSQVIIFYDSEGTWLEPIFTPGPKQWFGFRQGVETFTLRRNVTPDDHADPIGLALFEADSLAPNRYFASLQELRAKFPFLPTGAP